MAWLSLLSKHKYKTGYTRTLVASTYVSVTGVCTPPGQGMWTLVPRKHASRTVGANTCASAATAIPAEFVNFFANVTINNVKSNYFS